jgi:RNA polymerase sigma factor (sigma-70 family)
MNRQASRSTALYLNEISQTETIDSEEERILIYRWQRKRDTVARDALVRSHLRFVVTVARQHTRDPERLPDFIAAGNVGLLIALDRFDLAKNMRFLTYAAWWIRKEIFDEDYSTSTVVYVPPHRQKARRKKVKAFQRALTERGPDAAEVQAIDPGEAEGTTLGLDLLREALEDRRARSGPGLSEGELAAVSAAPNEADDQDRLRRAIARLPSREQTVLNLYYGVKDDPRSLRQIAALLDCSSERVRQLKDDGLVALKHLLAEPLPTSGS